MSLRTRSQGESQTMKQAAPAPSGAQKMRESDLRELVRQRYGDAVELERLQGDASNRMYYRVRTDAGSAILMVHEEAFREEELPFLNVAHYLSEIGSPVPEVLAAYPEQGVLVLEDLGDTLLQNYLAGRSGAEVETIYREAIDLVCLLQEEGTRRLTPACVAYHAALDFEKFDWELRFFAQNYVERLLSSPLSEAEDRALREWLRELARQTSGSVQVFCHRDYHSRNLIVHKGRLYMFDFQDARRGPRTYDLTSLLRDSYVELPEDTIGRLLVHFCERAGLECEGLKGEFDRMSLQRNIKALGTFAYQACLMHNSIYMQYVPRTMRYVLGNLAKFPSDAPILEIFDRRLKPEASTHVG
ncbi:MAG: phosphotransferase [Acidobacteriota bacterium]